MKTKEGSDVTSLANEPSPHFIEWGVPELDKLTGGIPIGRITEVVGAPGVGKSTLVSTIAANLSKTGKVLYCDSEQSLNKDRVASLGGNLKNIDYTALNELEKVAALVLQATHDYPVIIIDSIATLTPKSILDGDIGEQNIGLFSRQMAKWMKQLKPVVKTTGCVVICVNQWRQSPSMYQPTYVPGGTTYMHALDLRLDLTCTPSKDAILVDKIRVGHWVKVKILKSRISQPYLETRYKLMYGKKQD